MPTADEIAALFMAQPTPEDPAPLPPKMVSVRVPMPLLATIDAMAHHTEQTRSAMLVQLVDAGIQAVMGCLPHELIEEVEKSASDYLNLNTQTADA